MSLREELAELIRLEVGRSPLGDRARMATGEKVWGSTQDSLDFLTAYCRGIENAVLRLGDEVEALRGDESA